MRRVPTLALSLRDKDQQIKLLIKERDEQKFQAELMARRADEWREKFEASELERSHVASEADDEVVELRRLAQEFEDENRKLVEKLQASERLQGDVQFKLDELECERQELAKELESKEEQLVEMEREQRELNEGSKTGGQLLSERAMSKAKYEREIEELKEKIVCRDEQMIQLRSSLEVRKQEVQNLQSHSAELERRLKIESERGERQQKRIDEINLELKAAEARLTTKVEENEVQENQVRQLRQELRQAEERLEQVSLARKKDVDVLHNKLVAARRAGSTTPTSPQPYKTPTPQDEIVRLQMEIRDLKDQLIDREAELDCNRRDLEVIRRKMETRTLEVDCNNQELARRCQDLLEQNRQSEDTVKQLLKSSTEHSAQLLRATEDLKEANGKCNRLRDEAQELESRLDEQLQRSGSLVRENNQLKEENELQREQIEHLKQQVSNLNEQLGELCEQLDVQTANLHKDREQLADQLSQQEIELAQLRHELATSRQDLRSNKLQTQELVNARDMLRSELEIKEKYIKSRLEQIEQLKRELEASKKSLGEQRAKVEQLRESTGVELEQQTRELRQQLESQRKECQARLEECGQLKRQCQELEAESKRLEARGAESEDEKFDEMRRKHAAELDGLKVRLAELERELEEAKSATLRRLPAASEKTTRGEGEPAEQVAGDVVAPEADHSGGPSSAAASKDYETQIEFLNSLVVDMQAKCDDYKSRLAQMETISIVSEFDNLILASEQSRSSTLRKNRPVEQGPPSQSQSQTMSRPRVVRIQEPHEKPVARISGRPYCDICQVYDRHHTVYCPQVSEKLAARQQQQVSSQENNNNYLVDEMFREYEQSLDSNRPPALKHQFSSLRRPQPPAERPYCDHCDLFGHTPKSCHALKV